MTNNTSNPFAGKPFAELFSEYKEAYRKVNSSDDDDAVTAAANHLHQIEEAIWSTPAANIAEAHLKLEVASRDYTHGSLIPEHALQSVMDDARRLLTGGRSPLFDPKLWLALWTKGGGGYVISCDQLNLIVPIANDFGRTNDLLNEISQTNNRAVLKAYILESEA